jgi:hypothetical protein
MMKIFFDFNARMKKFSLRQHKALIKPRTPVIDPARRNSRVIKKNFSAHRSPKIDVQKNLQLLNGGLDIILKFGALSMILGALVVRVYLKEIGGDVLYMQFIGSPGGLFAIVFGLGLVFLAMFLSQMVSPFSLRFTKNLFASDQHLNLLSGRRIFFGMVAGQFYILIVILSDVTEVACIGLAVIAIATIVRFEKTKLGFPHVCLVIGLFFAQFFSVLPWLYLSDILRQSEIASIRNLDKDWLEIGGISLWVVIYSSGVAAYVNFKKADSRESPFSYFIGLAFLFGFILYLLILMSPKFFVNSSITAVSLRQTQKQSNWWFVDSSTLNRISRVGNSDQSLKIEDGNTYICGYSPFLYSERIVLCPHNIAIPTLKACYVFTAAEARPAVVPDKGWTCGR